MARPSTLEVANAYLCPYDFVAFGFHRLAELGPRWLDRLAGPILVLDAGGLRPFALTGAAKALELGVGVSRP